MTNTARPSSDLERFLRESNAIEDVHDEDSYQQALTAWEYLIQHSELTPQVVCKTHALLMVNQPLHAFEKGFWRKVPVHVGDREGVPYRFLPSYMSDWCWMNNHMTSADTIRDSHVRYEIIHPFVDGNGRTGRMFLNFQRVQCNLPLLIIEAADRQAYYDWFKEGRAKDTGSRT